MNNKAFVIRPNKSLEVGRLEKNKVKLEKLFDQGYSDSKNCFNKLSEWINI